jgi:dTDP-4-dehydrorhamnose reductase
MTRIVIFGAKGMLGTAATAYFKSAGYNVVALIRDVFDIAHDPLDKISNELKSADVVFNCAGVIKPMIAKTPIEDVLRVNAIFPRNLAHLCKRLDVPLVHVTTDCVYDGLAGRYDENAVFDADDVYGMSKCAGESSDAMNLRTSIIGEEAPPGRSLLAWAISQRGKAVNGFTNHLWNGVTTTYLSEVVDSILKKQAYAPGTYHIFSPEAVTKDELLKILDSIYELDLDINPMAADKPCDRSLSSIYRLSAENATATIPEQVSAMRAFFDKQRESVPA